ncbi:hypothetical protein FRB90_006584, partial [Tulasnella sp. 427]
TKDKIDVQQVNLFDGANFAPRFSQKICLLPRRDNPTLITPGESPLTDTTVIVQRYRNFVLVLGLPVVCHQAPYRRYTKASGNEVRPDPRGRRRPQHPPSFIYNRQAALQKYVATAPDLKSFHDVKLQSNGFLDLVYAADPPTELKETWFSKSETAWDAIRAFILNDLGKAVRLYIDVGKLLQ